MSPETAELIFYSVTSTMAFVWLVATWFAFSRIPRLGSKEESALRGSRDREEDAVAGEILLEGEAEPISRKITEQLAAASLVQGGTKLTITERTAEQISFKATPARTRGAIPSCLGSLTLKQEGDRVRVRCSVQIGNLRRTLRIVSFLVCFIYGGIFVVGVPVLVWLLVLQSEDSSVRVQVFQTFQMVHGVWPPFLLGFLWSRMKRAATQSVLNFLGNLRHVV